MACGFYTSADKVRLFFSGLLGVFCLLTPLNLAAADDLNTDSLAEYWSLTEFEQIDPVQRRNSGPFAKRVAAPAHPLFSHIPVPPLERAPDRPVKIALVYPSRDNSEYWQRSQVALEARLRELGLPYDIRSFSSHSGRYPSGMSAGGLARQVAKALTDDPDYLVFTLDSAPDKAIAQRLIARGRPKVILQNITTPVRAWSGRQPFLYVGFDDAAGTQMLVEHYEDTLGSKKDFAILFGPKGYVSQGRGIRFLQAYYDAAAENLKASYYTGYDRARSRQAASRILEDHPTLSFIYTSATDIALGAADAIRAHGLEGKVSTNGWGGGSAELDALAEGTLQVTVMRMNDDAGVAMAEAIALDTAGRGNEVPVVYSGSFVLLTAAECSVRLSTLKARAFRYSK